MTKLKQNCVNHVVLVLDASSSMTHLKSTVIKVGDDLVKFLADRSQQMDQETRITVYAFADQAECIVYDTDVLRLPSLAKFYSPYGNTALIDATMLAIDDAELTPQKYGDHAFLMFVLTDGQENASGRASRYTYGTDSKLIASFHKKLTTLPDNWTVAAMVPNTKGKIAATDYGFPGSNVEIWDATTIKGMEESGRLITAATSNWMEARSTGARSVANVFSTGTDAVNAAAVAAAGLKPLPQGSYVITHVPEKTVIKDFVEAMGMKYRVGDAFYELVKREEIQARKDIAIQDKRDDAVYTGPTARDLLGLPAMNVRVSPDKNPDFRIFVQSTSTNRVLPEHTKLLVLK